MVKLLGENQLKVKDQNNCIQQVHVADIKKTMPEVLVKNIPDYKQFGRAVKLRLNPNNIEDLGWKISTQVQTQPLLPDTEVSEVSSVAPEPMSQDTTTSQGESFQDHRTKYMVLVYDRSFQGSTKSMSHCCLHQHYLPMCQSTLVST